MSDITLKQKRNPIEGDIKQEIVGDSHFIYIYTCEGSWRVIHACEVEKVVTEVISCRRSGKSERDVIREGIEELKDK